MNTKIFNAGKKDNICFLLLITVFLGLIIRGFYGLDIGDESFYYVVAKKFSEGRIPILDEYNPSQLFGLLIIPFYDIYSFFVPDLTGIILAGRIVHSLCMFAGGLYIYSYLKRWGYFTACLSGVFFMCCKVSRIWGLGYYNLYICCGIIGAVLLLDGGKIKNILAGLCFSVCIVCMPLSVIPIFAAVIYLISAKNRSDCYKTLFVIIICIAGIAAYVVGNAGLDNILQTLPYVFSNAKSSGNVSETSYMGVLRVSYMMLTYFFKSVIIEICVIVILSFMKNISVSAILKIFTIDLVVSVFIDMFFGLNNAPDSMYAKLIIVGLYIAFRFEDIRKDFEIIFFLAFGIMLSMFFCLGSSFAASSICTGMGLSAIGSLMALHNICKSDIDKLCFRILCVVCFALLMACTFMSQSYADNVFSKLNCRLTKGPGAYLYVSALSERQNEELYEIKDIIDENADESADIAVSRRYPYSYLIFNRKINCPVSWDIPLDDKRQEFYYSEKRHDFPDIFVLFSEEAAAKLYRDDMYEMMNRNNPKIGWLYEQILDNYVQYNVGGNVICIKR